MKEQIMKEQIIKEITTLLNTHFESYSHGLQLISDAADRISEMGPDWISVENRLPNKEDGLCYDDGHAYSVEALVIAEGKIRVAWCNRYSDGHSFWTSGPGTTHWMRLPAQPGGRTTDGEGRGK